MAFGFQCISQSQKKRRRCEDEEIEINWEINSDFIPPICSQQSQETFSLYTIQVLNWGPLPRGTWRFCWAAERSSLNSLGDFIFCCDNCTMACQHYSNSTRTGDSLCTSRVKAQFTWNGGKACNLKSASITVCIICVNYIWYFTLVPLSDFIQRNLSSFF